MKVTIDVGDQLLTDAAALEIAEKIKTKVNGTLNKAINDRSSKHVGASTIIMDGEPRGLTQAEQREIALIFPKTPRDKYISKLASASTTPPPSNGASVTPSSGASVTASERYAQKQANAWKGK